MTPASPEPAPADALTRGTLLDGRVGYDQPAAGHRSGIEPVFLAAGVPARPGQRVLEAGTGAGAALLCLAARVPGVLGLGIELDRAAAAAAARNFAALGSGELRAMIGDITALPLERDAFDHAMANPPWHDAAGTPSPDASRERARRGTPQLLATWLAGMARAVRRRGTVTLIARAATVPAFIEALAGSELGSPLLLPLWPRAHVEAKLVLMQATRGGRSPLRLLPGIVLHAADGGYTAAAAAILRDGAALPLGIRPARNRNAEGTSPAACCTVPALAASG